MTETAPGRGLEDMLAAIDVVDPYPLWQSLLDGGPVVAPDGSFALLTRHADIDAVLRSPLWSADRRRSTRFRDPLRLDAARMTPHLALSAGPHHCLGAPLARLEARVVLGDLARRLLEPALGRLEYRENRVLRGPSVLEVEHGGLLP